ncbi:hypothetical protein [Taibaiella koreensis]|uniref:hypothetical protein n=1 Tax=Taibaiella koreensis TaxID=1268548 RepID=UPI000E59B927|nr:hypothetical protein [Taibaiella koreensis]
MTKKDKDNYLKWGVIGVGVYLGFKLIKPLAAATGSVGNVIATQSENAVIKQSTGLSTDEVTLCRDVATQTYSAMNVTGFWQFSWFGGSTEDEDTVITQLNRLQTATQAEVASDFYKTVSGSGLASDVNKYLSGSDRNRIKSLILSNLR